MPTPKCCIVYSWWLSSAIISSSSAFHFLCFFSLALFFSLRPLLLWLSVALSEGWLVNHHGAFSFSCKTRFSYPILPHLNEPRFFSWLHLSLSQFDIPRFPWCLCFSYIVSFREKLYKCYAQSNFSNFWDSKVSKYELRASIFLTLFLNLSNTGKHTCQTRGPRAKSSFYLALKCAKTNVENFSEIHKSAAQNVAKRWFFSIDRYWLYVW